MNDTSEQADNELKELRRMREEATWLLEELEAVLKTVKDIGVSVSEVQSVVSPEIDDMLIRVKQALAEAQSAATNAETSFQTVAQFVKLAEEYEMRNSLSRKNLADLKTEYSEVFVNLKHSIESLLPGATSAGLAEAFANRKLSILNSQKLWKRAFALGLATTAAVALCVIMYPEFFKPKDISVNDGQLLWIVAALIPKIAVLGAPIWLAAFAAKQLAVRFRLEEDYAYKEALAKSFEGYKKQMSGVTTEGVDGALAGMVLTAMGKAPVDLYEKRVSTESPFERFLDSIGILPRPQKGASHDKDS
jgi:hypothetical protein